MAINATFSALCAVTLLLGSQQLAALLGRVDPLLLQIIGVGLILFAVELVCQIFRRRLSTLRALMVSIADMVWVLASVVLLVFWPGALSGSGAAIVALVAAVVLLCALLQLSGIHRIHGVPGRSSYRHCVPITVKASAESLWAIVGKLDSIAQYAPHLASSQLVNGDISGVGSVRHCEDINGKQWSERCTAYEPGHRLELEFLTEEPGFPLPVRNMVGGWELKPLSGNRCEIRVWWELEPNVRFLALFLMPIFGHIMDRHFRDVMNKMAGGIPVQARGLARFLPIPC